MLKSIKKIGNEILEIVNYLKGLFKKQTPSKPEVKVEPAKVEVVAETQAEELPKKPKRKYYHKHKPKAK